MVQQKGEHTARAIVKPPGLKDEVRFPFLFLATKTCILFPRTPRMYMQCLNWGCHRLRAHVYGRGEVGLFPGLSGLRRFLVFSNLIVSFKYL